MAAAGSAAAAAGVDMPAALFVVQVAATLCMTGLIWFVQVVHYPLFRRVGEAAFVRYETLHARRTGWVVGAPMVVELLTAVAALWPGLRVATMSRAEAWVGAALVVVLWASTGLVQVPLHERLGRERSVEAMGRLVRSNWVRTVAWTGRSWVLLAVVWRGLT